MWDAGSDFVVVVADTDHVGDIVVLFLFVGEEGIVVVAEVHIVLVIAEIGKIVGFRILVRLFERDDLDALFA